MFALRVSKLRFTTFELSTFLKQATTLLARVILTHISSVAQAIESLFFYMLIKTKVCIEPFLPKQIKTQDLTLNYFFG